MRSIPSKWKNSPSLLLYVEVEGENRRLLYDSEEFEHE